MPQALTDTERKLIHDLALEGRALLTREARELLEGTYGLYPDGRLDPPDKLPQIQNDPEAGATYRRLAQFLADEEQAGLPRPEAVTKLVKEIAFTHLNRLVAFKMMEARKLIRGTLDKGLDSNAFKFYLADPDYAEDYTRYQQGDDDTAYRHFLLWQAGQVAREVRVLFDPDTLPSRLFPRPRALQTLIERLNQPELDLCWQADETVGWLYQYFNEQEKARVFERLYKQKKKIRRQDLPAATQLFTPNWIVRFLVQNTLGRLWVQMHPDTRLVGTELLDYLAPIAGGAETTTTDPDLQSPNPPIPQSPIPPEPLRPIADVTLLDPACGTMHFGLVAFDLFAAMYREELERAGEPGWLETPSVSDPADIPAGIIRNNLFGIDIDLRAVQLSALSLYLKAKALNKQVRITDSNLACADVLPLNGARLGQFLKEARFTRPIYERLIRALWNRLKDLNEIGSLLRLEEELDALVAEERARYEKAPLFAGLPGEFEREAAEEEFWHIIAAQIIQGLDEFARQQAEQGSDVTLFVGEAVKGLRVLDLMSRRYDVVVTNPPYSGKRNLSDKVAKYLDSEYPNGKGDLYTAFTLRCTKLTEDNGRLGMITQQSFMFIAAYKKLRKNLRDVFAIESMAHTGPRAFAEISGEKVNTTIFTFRVDRDTLRRENCIGTYFRLVDASEGEGKRLAFEQTLQNDGYIYNLSQNRFDIIDGSPWIYWMYEKIRKLFEIYPSFDTIALPTGGMTTGDNTRFLRYWWELSKSRVGWQCSTRFDAEGSKKTWFPYMKGGTYRKWYGNQTFVVNWREDGGEIRNFTKADGRAASFPRSMDCYFREGVTWSDVSSGGFAARLSPGGFIFDASGPSAFPVKDNDGTTIDITLVLGHLNSSIANHLLGMINPTIHYQTGDLARLPVPHTGSRQLSTLVGSAIRYQIHFSCLHESTFDFITPSLWETGLTDLTVAQKHLAELEVQIDDEVYHLYGLSDEDRAAIETELAGERHLENNDSDETEILDNDDGKEPTVEAPITAEELAVRWISYAVGVVLGRFQPGVPDELGSAVYRRSDFAVGSLPEPDGTEFDQLVGPPERFAYIDENGGRHRFPAEVETALRDLAVSDGITVLDEGHPRDLPTLVEKALTLMLGANSVPEVVAAGTGGSLRKFLERNYFTKWHLAKTWYRKRPVYWPFQSAKRSYGFVIFHERVDKSTLYVLQRDYLDHKLNGLRLHLGDLQGQMEGQTGAARKKIEREIDQTSQRLDELTEFAQTIDRLVRQGYEPKDNWLDDGVILRLAPLWELIPIWKNEPKKYWQRLQTGDFDWSHIAMHYWPERVKEKCKTNKSFAIAHGLEEQE